MRGARGLLPLQTKCALLLFETVTESSTKQFQTLAFDHAHMAFAVSSRSLLRSSLFYLEIQFSIRRGSQAQSIGRRNKKKSGNRHKKFVFRNRHDAIKRELCLIEFLRMKKSFLLP